MVTIADDEWRGVSSGAITAAYAAEATETTDNSPTLARPTISTERAQAFIPFSIEIGQDWVSLQQELTVLLQDAKDTLEATKFVTGTGTNEPFGFITGATTRVNATEAGVLLRTLVSPGGLEPPTNRSAPPNASVTGNDHCCYAEGGVGGQGPR